MRSAMWQWVAVAALLVSIVGCTPMSEEDQNRVIQWTAEKEVLERKVKEFDVEKEKLQKKLAEGVAVGTYKSDDVPGILTDFLRQNEANKQRLADLNFILSRASAPNPIYGQIALGVCLLAAIGAMFDARKCRRRIAELEAGSAPKPPSSGNA